jgi:hypothetical protein
VSLDDIQPRTSSWLLAPGSWHNVGVHSQTYDIDALK